VQINVIKHSFLHVTGDTTICPNDSIQLSVTGDSLKSFRWESSASMQDTLNAMPTIHADGNMRYRVYGIDSNNCRDTAAVLVRLHPAAVISLPDTIVLYPGDSMQLSPETNCLYFKWTPPNGLSATDISNPVASPGVDTRYIAAGTTEQGCSTTDTIRIKVSPDSYVSIPNAFAPGNGPNNILKVLHLGNAVLNSFHIYNRWGADIFHTSNINEGWDGTFNGQPQPMGVYVYSIEATTYKGVKFVKHGNITLLR
jgi:gliding motility-associated-like protein